MKVDKRDVPAHAQSEPDVANAPRPSQRDLQLRALGFSEGEALLAPNRGAVQAKASQKQEPALQLEASDKAESEDEDLGEEEDEVESEGEASTGKARPEVQRSLDGKSVQLIKKKKKKKKAKKGTQGQDAKKPATEGKDEQALSWVSTAAGQSGSGLHVGVIYFPTRSSSLDGYDQTCIKQLAAAYAPYAKRNLGKTGRGAVLGVTGSVTGHADPRRSQDPDNVTLSELRASAVQSALVQELVAATGLEERFFRISITGAGADLVPSDAPEVETSKFAPLRRADIYLDGEVLVADAPPQKKDEAPPKPPDIGKDYDNWDRWAVYMDEGNKEFIRDVAHQMVGVLVVDQSGDIISNTPLALGAYDATRGGSKPDGGTIPFKPVRPPWWGSRGPEAPSSGMGRRAPDANQVLIHKQQLMRRDFKETMFFISTEFSAGNGAYMKYMNEYKKDPPDIEKLQEYAQTVGYILFMKDATQDLALEVAKLAGG